MMNAWMITLMAVLSSQAGFSSSFAPSSSSSSIPRRTQGSSRSSTQVFYQSSIAMPPEQQQQQQQQQQENLFSRRSVYRDSFRPKRTKKTCQPVKIQVRDVLKKTKANKRTVRVGEYTNNIQETKEEDEEEERQKQVLRAHSLLELKLTCSRRNIRYGTFAAPKQKDEYVDAIWNEMRHEGSANVVSVTGLLQHPGTVVELTQAQLEQELGFSSSSMLILVDVYAPWCTPCRDFLPQLELATTVLSLKQKTTARSSTPVRVVKLNYDELQPSWIERYDIAGLPGLLLFQSQERGAVLIDRMDGSHTTPEIVAFVQQHTTTTTSAAAR